VRRRFVSRAATIAVGANDSSEAHVSEQTWPAARKAALQLAASPSGHPVACQDALEFNQVFAEYGAYVLGLLRRLGIDAADVEDVAQEVFMAVHAGLPAFEGRSALKTWLCGICLRRAADYRRRMQRRRETLSAQPPELTESALPEDRLVSEQQAAAIYAVLAQLPDKLLQVFVLYELDELPMSDVARAVGCPRFTAYTRLHTARRRVRALFEAAARSGSQT
jgi:RNA polymerase sigma-70 factor (ECF subfamily)